VTIPSRVARHFAGQLAVEVREPPLDLPPFAVSQVWHARSDGDAGHAWLRSQLVEVTREA
jgi:DNA-binding transcriptional LysR family regulator